MTDAQKQVLEEYLEYLLKDNFLEFHHGDCVGADAEAHKIFLGKVSIVIHPPIDTKKRVFCGGDSAGNGVTILKAKDYLDRNHDIVDATDFLIATPDGYKEKLRSGTWATIRYAQKQGKIVAVIWPNGITGTLGKKE